MAQKMGNVIHFQIPFQDHEQYHAGRTKQRGGPQVSHVCFRGFDRLSSVSRSKIMVENANLLGKSPLIPQEITKRLVYFGQKFDTTETLESRSRALLYRLDSQPSFQ